MTSQLQFQKPAQTPTATTATSPPQQTLLQTAPTVLLSRHVIEPELLGTTPRFVTKTPTQAFNYCYRFVQIGVVTFNLCRMYVSHPNKRWETLVLAAIVLTVIGGLHGFTWNFARQTCRRLRFSIPRSAVVGMLSNKASRINGFYKLTYWYENLQGQIVEATRDIPSRKVGERELEIGDTFTVLISPDKETDILPYFLASEYRVVPVDATDVSRAVSARLAAHDAHVAAQPVGVLGAVEPELLGATPRRVHATRAKLRRLQLATALLAALVLFVNFKSQLGFGKPANTMTWLMLFLQVFAQVLIQSGLRSERNGLTEGQYLRNGIPARAFVTHEENTMPEKSPMQNNMMGFSYKYESADGTVQCGSLTLQRKRAWQLGLTTGATFTVLYNPKHPHVHTPYFQITDAEIVGAMGAKVTPP